MPAVLRRLTTRQPDFEQQLQALLARDEQNQEGIAEAVRDIIGQVRTRGHAALLEYVKQFEGTQANQLSELILEPADLKAAFGRLPDQGKAALEFASRRIKDYHEHQQESSWEYKDEWGNRLGQRIGPLERVGFYIPGGQASYPSSVLMTMIPAQVAGVDELVMVSPSPLEAPNDWVLGAAFLAGAHLCYSFGGAHSIAALAYGTESITAVDKIVGPGGLYVTEAKRQVFGCVGIDMIAGPSEVLIISDGSAHPEWLALDLLSQAEHDAAAQACLISPDAAHLDAVAAALEVALASLPRAKIAAQSLSARGALIACEDLPEAVALANRIAPEHLQLAVQNTDDLLPDIRHAGAIFVGARTPEVVGDYTAGPSHVLPTSGTARFSSPLGVYDFLKRSSVIQMSQQPNRELLASAAVLAEAEGLDAHAMAARVRLQDAD